MWVGGSMCVAIVGVCDNMCRWVCAWVTMGGNVWLGDWVVDG